MMLHVIYDEITLIYDILCYIWIASYTLSTVYVSTNQNELNTILTIHIYIFYRKHILMNIV